MTRLDACRVPKRTAIRFVDRERQYGGFLEELLTIRGPQPG